MAITIMSASTQTPLISHLLHRLLRFRRFKRIFQIPLSTQLGEIRVILPIYKGIHLQGAFLMLGAPRFLMSVKIEICRQIQYFLRSQVNTQLSPNKTDIFLLTVGLNIGIKKLFGAA